MSEKTKGILAAVVVVACIGLLGFMVQQKASGAEVAAIAVVTTIVAWVTRAPDRRDPPSGAAVVAGLVAAVSFLACGCAGQDKALAAESAYKEQQRACVRQYFEESEILACRAKVRAEWRVDTFAPARDGGL